ncbi:hypothetical protein ACHAXA_001526 [Cyclostephanos tholiformis]|uniref:N-acetyltransferase domain-containing protein n=1 Tax=Cyclostephanos tholiformis TaxID=382380 RepID=A0ABD3RX27_9STRA
MAALRRTSATKPSAAFLVCLLMAALERTACAFIIPTTKASRHNRRHQRGGSVGGAATTSTTTTTTAWSTATAIAEIDEITDFACRNGIELKFTTRGPGYRCVAASKSDPENVLGYVEGFIRPTGRILHADKMEIFKSAINSARRSEEGEFDGGGSFLGPGLLIAYVCLLHGRECGCETAEFLAIDDAEYQHKRLIRYYRMAGFREVRYVGEELKDIPDRLVWGGCGTLMTEDIDLILTKWTRIIRRSKAKMEGSIIQE